MNYLKGQKDKRASHYAGLAWEIATSPIIVYGGSAAQPHKIPATNIFLYHAITSNLYPQL